jgi:hypothetical protein
MVNSELKAGTIIDTLGGSESEPYSLFFSTIAIKDVKKYF